MTSEVTLRAQAFVTEHLPEARGLGDALAELIDEPRQFVDVLREGLERLADEPYAREQERVAPGSGVVFGVRGPLLAAITRQLRKPLAEISSASALWLADRLVIEPEREIELVGYAALRRSLPDDPERTWQLMRRLGHAAATGSASTRWPSSSRRESCTNASAGPSSSSSSMPRVAGSAAWSVRPSRACPSSCRAIKRHELTSTPGLTLIKSLLGDAEPDVQRSPVSASRTFDIFNQNGWGRSLHFLAAWLLVIPGVVSLLARYPAVHFRFHMWPRAAELTPRRFWQDVVRPPAPADPASHRWAAYGSFQKCASCTVVFVAFPLSILTGLTMSPAVTAAFPFLLSVFGEYQFARTIHFFAFTALVLFVIAHVVMVVLSGFARQMRGMIFREIA